MIRRPPRSTLFPSTPPFRAPTRSRPRPPREHPPPLQPPHTQARRPTQPLTPRPLGTSPLRPPVTFLHTLPPQAPLHLPLSRRPDRKSTRLNSSHANISYAVF